MKQRAANTLVAAFLLCLAASAAFGDTAVPTPGDGGSSAEETVADSTGTAADAGVPADAEAPGDADRPNDAEPPLEAGALTVFGGDVRRVRGGDIGSHFGDVAGILPVGGGWPGARSSLARGVLPAALTEVTFRGRRWCDWVNGGLDLVSCSRPAAGTLVVPAGPDLSTWPVYTSEEPEARLDGDTGGGPAPYAPLSVGVRPAREPSQVPFGRFTMGSGALGRRFHAVEFGRRFRERVGLVGYLEKDDGRAPVPGGSFDVARAGAAAFVDIADSWTAELGGVRSDVARGTPAPGLIPASLRSRSVVSDIFLRATDGTTRLEVYHTQSWLESDRLPASIDARRDGVAVELPSLGPVWPLSAQLERRTAEGDAMGGGSESVHIVAGIHDTLEIRSHRLSVGAGVSLADDQSFPTAHASWTSGHGTPARWRLSGTLAGRHPTVVERSLVSVEAAAPDGAELTVRGSASLDPERALCVSAQYVRDDLLSGTGARAELVRVMRPIVLSRTSESEAAPMNADDESGGSLMLWTAAGDSAGPAGGLSLAWLVTDANGALNAGSPTPEVRARASGSIPLSLFDDYLATRCEASLTFESGLARGPWEGLLEDSRTVLSLSAVGSAGSARLFVTITDALNTDSGRLPGADPEGRILTAGFSWRFVD